MAHIVHIDLNDFLVSVERKHDPSLNGRAVVIGGQPTGWGRVVAASREAVQRGVKPGMSLSVAASRCPSAIFLDGEFDRYLDASAAIDELLRESRLPVEWTSIDSVFIDASGAAANWRRPAARLAARLAAARARMHVRWRNGCRRRCAISWGSKRPAASPRRRSPRRSRRGSRVRRDCSTCCPAMRSVCSRRSTWRCCPICRRAWVRSCIAPA